MEIVGWILWAVAILFVFSWIRGIRTYVRTGRGVQQATVNQTMLLLGLVLAVPLIGFSPLHLLWLLPVGFVVGMLSLTFPFSLLSILGKPFGRLCCLGLDPHEVARNTQRLERFSQLVTQGMTPEEAMATLEREGAQIEG